MSLDERVASLEVKLGAALARIEALEAGCVQGVQNDPNGPGRVATDYEMGGQYGDPIVRKDPRRWGGPSCVGLRLSRCPPEFLDELAEFFDWQGNKDKESGAVDNKNRPRAPYKFKDAARARGFAKRLRAGWKPPPLPTTHHDEDGVVEQEPDASDLEIPF